MSVAKNSFFIQAANIHCGGGINLLIPLLQSIPATQPTQLLIDSRAVLPEGLSTHLVIHRVSPSLSGRWRAERWLQSAVGADDQVLCFGNLPPAFRLKGQVTVFVQNRYLIDKVSLAAFNWKTALRLRLERAWLKMTSQGVSRFVVQTATMRRLLSESLGIRLDRVRVLPYIAQDATILSSGRASPILSDHLGFDFIYPASGDPHKNHRCLIDAWCLLAQQGIRPRLLLTIDRTLYPDLCEYLTTRIIEHGLDIVNDGFVAHDVLYARYRQAKALIYPSLVESFGMPLLEARMAGLPILAGELDYVRDVVDPLETFDAQSSVSITRAVRRFLGFPEPTHVVQGAPAFLSDILKTCDAEKVTMHR